MNTQEKGRVDSAALVQSKEQEDRNAAIGGVNGENGANGSGGHSNKRIVHLKRSGGHGVSCGLDVHYFRDATVSRAIAEVNCRRCLRAHGALTALRCKARRWDRLAGRQPKRTYKPRRLVSLAVAFDRAAQP
jgi:hypothetical protein